MPTLTPSPYTHYSVSRLKDYQFCGRYYEHKHLLKTACPKYSDATLIGSLCHDALELLYTSEDPAINNSLDAFQRTSKQTLIDQGVLTPANADEIHPMLLMHADLQEQLHRRAHPSYTGSDAIRKGDGGIAKSPQMTSQWKQAERDLGISILSNTINYSIHQDNPELGDLSIPDIFSQAYFLSRNYRTPSEIEGIVAVEFPFSDWNGTELVNPVPMPPGYGGESDIYIKGFIDLIAIVHGRLAIIDHKTSKEELSEAHVAHNVQLMVYAYAYSLLTGKQIHYIGINNIRYNKLILVPLDYSRMMKVMSSLFSYNHHIQSGIFPEYTPDSIYSPCLNCYGGTCPFLSACHPTFG